MVIDFRIKDTDIKPLEVNDKVIEQVSTHKCLPSFFSQYKDVGETLDYFLLFMRMLSNERLPGVCTL